MNSERRFLSSNRRLNRVDIERILLKRFYRPYKLNIQSKNATLYLHLSYHKPQSIKDYDDVFNELSKVINMNDAGDLFINIIECSVGHPDFLIIDGDIIDIPFVINLHIPSDFF